MSGLQIATAAPRSVTSTPPSSTESPSSILDTSPSLEEALFDDAGGGGDGGDGASQQHHEPPRHVLESRKVALPPGHSQAAWLSSMSQRRPRERRKVPPDLLRQHCDEDSVWIAYRGVVYDVTEYMP